MSDNNGNVYVQQITAEAIEAAFANAGGGKDLTRCNVGRLCADYPALEPKIMDVAHYSAPTIQRVLRALGLDTPSTEMIQKHRRGICRCTKETK